MQLPDFIKTIMQTFLNKGYDIYMVGGAVRNMLLNLPNDNWDLTTNAIPEQIQELFPDSFYLNTYGTVTIKHEEDGVYIPVEVTTYRTEQNYLDNRHPSDICWAKTLEEDVLRRDFTVNALAMTIDGQIIDLVHGKTDLENKIIRTVGDANIRFKEDGLRILRALRFATQLEFNINTDTFVAISRNISLLDNISFERIRDEFFKILISDKPELGIVLLRKADILQKILPEVEACFAIDQVSPNRHHKYNVGTHLLMTLKHCTSKHPITRFACLLHDIGKAKTYKKDLETGQITFYNHEVVGEELCKIIASRFKLSNKDTDMLIRLVRYHMFTVSEKQTDTAIKRFIRNVTPQYIDEMIALRVADRLGSGAKLTSWRTELFKKRIIEVQQEPFSVKDLKINGEDVMKVLTIQPGKKVGEILKKLFDKVEQGELKNEREELLQKIISL